MAYSRHSQAPFEDWSICENARQCVASQRSTTPVLRFAQHSGFDVLAEWTEGSTNSGGPHRDRSIPHATAETTSPVAPFLPFRLNSCPSRVFLPQLGERFFARSTREIRRAALFALEDAEFRGRGNGRGCAVFFGRGLWTASRCGAAAAGYGRHRRGGRGE